MALGMRMDRPAFTAETAESWCIHHRVHRDHRGTSAPRFVAAAFLAFSALARGVEGQTPSTDIYLIPLERAGDTWRLGTVINATARAGYDNQPFFLADGSGFLFTSIREDRQADTYRFDVATRTVTHVTATPESEYSPTPIPHRPGWFSAVRVEADSTQRLWAFRLDGTDAELVREDVKPVGYHAWIEGGGLALFVLGSPATAQVIAEPNAAPRVVAEDVGRGFGRIEGASGVFLTRRHDGGYQISRLDLPSFTIQPVVQTPRNDFFAWHEGTLFAGDESRVLAFRPGTDSAWVEIGDLGPQGVRGITRLAVSPDGKWLAVVGVEE
jgi:hypothetical protein